MEAQLSPGVNHSDVRRDHPDHALLHLGLPISLLQDVVITAAQDVARDRSEAKPHSAPGTELWIECTRYLVEATAEHGWVKREVNNAPRVISRNGQFAIGVISGDDATGTADKHPQLKNRCGPVIRHEVEVNTSILDASLSHKATYPHQPPLPIFHEIASGDAHLTYLLLLHADFHRQIVRAELSLPVLMTHQQVLGFAERHLLDEMSLASPVLPRALTTNLGQAARADIAYPIEPKAE